MDQEEAQAAKDEDEFFSRQKRLDQWREQGWPGLPSPDNRRVMRVARLWWAFDDLDLACQASEFCVPRTRAEGYLVRLGMAYRHYRERAEKERKRA